MTNIQLMRSGGLLGKPLQATRRVDIDENTLIEQLKSATPIENKQARDNFHYSITIDGTDSYPVDISQLKGKLKKIIEEMEDDLSY